MDADETSAYVDRVRRRGRRVRLAWVIFAVALTVAIVTLPGSDWGCEYSIRRENFAVPDLTGLRVHEARERVPTCVDLEPVDPTQTGDSDGRIVSQHPEPPDVLNHQRSIQVVLEPAH